MVPDRLAGAAVDDPDRVVLCPDCHAKLERVLAGALSGLDVDSGGVASEASGRSDAGAVSGEITFDDAGGHGPGDDGTDAVRISADADDAGDDDPETADPGDEGDIEGGVGVDVVPGPSAEREADPTGSGPSEGADASESPVDDDSAAAAAEGDGSAAAADASDGESSGGLRRLGDSGTSQYRKALRLLQNREFPMPRSDLIDVMGSAYDLRHDECERIVDFAVDRGWLVDDDGTLRRD